MILPVCNTKAGARNSAGLCLSASCKLIRWSSKIGLFFANLFFMRTVITGTGSFIPADIKLNKDFTLHDFYDAERRRITGAADEIVRKFELVTGISARRYADMETNASGMATLAATSAIRDAAIDPEALDQVIVAHNFGNVNKHTIQSDAV
jgi:3-oxoacyl-[acyl-carrier-protein] synthase-3